MTIIDDLQNKKLIHPPKWLSNNCHRLVIMGSMAYGVNENESDVDVYGVCVPPLDLTFPTTAGEIPGFGTQIQRFESWQEHHVKDSDRGKEYDFAIFSIVKYFHLCMQCNPNCVDSIFVPRECVIHTTALGEHIYENRKLFLHKGAYHKFRGYAYAQMTKLANGDKKGNQRRQADMDAYGFDTKKSYHTVRLAQECEMILEKHDLDLRYGNDILKSIRRGEWTLDAIKEWFSTKEKHLESLYQSSTLPHKPDEEAIKKVLMECLEMHYGSISEYVKVDQNYERMGREIRATLERYGV